ncbi:MAG: ABC transporter permease subunit [Verrucomicrobiales bacterium]
MPSTPSKSASRALRVILLRELRAIALSPASHIVAAVFLILQGIGFTNALRAFTEYPQERGLTEVFFQGAMFWIPYFALFPLLTMRLFAEEQKLGTMEMLLTAPLRVPDVVLGKYLAITVYYFLLWVPITLVFLLYPSLLGDTHLHLTATLWPTLALVGSMGMFNLALGCLASSMTTSQIAAGIMTFGLLMLHFLLGHLPMRLGELAEPVQRFFLYIHEDSHLRAASAGIWDSRPHVYHLSAAAFVLAATGFTLNLRRWQS